MGERRHGPEFYRDEALALRELAMKTGASPQRDKLLEIADEYDRLAGKVDAKAPPSGTERG